MKRMASLVGLVTIVAIANASTSLPQHVQNTLTPIDSVPTKQQLDVAFDGAPQALQSLAVISADTTADIGIRLRAVHALAKYCGPCAASDLAHRSLTDLVAANVGRSTGPEVLLLRAGVETLGTVHVASDVNVLIPLLDHPSRDIRAATARALQQLCNAQAIAPLRVRYTTETAEQVRLAISEALRILGQC